MFAMENGRSSWQRLHHPEEAQSNIKVPMSDQSAVPLTDTASQSNHPAPQSSPVPTDEEKVFCDGAELLVADDGCSTNWYIARCSSHKRSVRPLYEHIISNYPQIEVYWPQKPEKKGRDDKGITVSPVLNEYLFIKSDLRFLLKLFQDERIYTLGFLLKRMSMDGRMQYAMVRDSEMLKFKWVCDNQFNTLIVIDQQTTQLRDGLKVRITDGLLKGKEGVIYRYKGSRSFAISFDSVFSESPDGSADKTEKSFPVSGYMTFRVTKSLQQNMEVIDDDAKTKHLYSVMSLVDMLQSHIRNIKDEKNDHPYSSTSAHVLNLLILNHLYHSPLLTPDLLKKYRWISQESDIQEKSTRTHKLKPKEYVLKDEAVLFPELEQINKVISTLDESHIDALYYLVQYAVINLEHDLTSSTIPTLSTILLQGQISPFITHRGKHACHATRQHNDFLELVTKVDMSDVENTAQQMFHSLPSESKEKATSEYDAHIAIFRDESKGYYLVTNWALYENVIEAYKQELQDEESAQNKNTVLALQKMPVLYSVLKECNPSNVTFGSHKDLYGTMIHVPEVGASTIDCTSSLPEVVQQQVQHLIHVSVAIIREIWSSPLYDLRKNLPKVWIRPASVANLASKR